METSEPRDQWRIVQWSMDEHFAFIHRVSFDLLSFDTAKYKYAKQNEATWMNIPNIIIPVYSHYCDSKLVQKNSRVKFNLIYYELR